MTTLNEYNAKNTLSSYKFDDDIKEAGVNSVNCRYKAELNYTMQVNNINREDIDECDLFWDIYETHY